MKVEQSKIPLEDHRRYAIDQEIKKDNPLAALLAQGKPRPPSLQQSSSLSVSHLSILLLSKESTYSWTSFFPPFDLSLEHLFSFEVFSNLQQASDKFSSFIAKEKDVRYKGEYAISALFTRIKELQDMFVSIQSQRIGIQQG
ncbi:MAG: hypothetical protein V4489_00240 [Chlamydiota bacterium]